MAGLSSEELALVWCIVLTNLRTRRSDLEALSPNFPRLFLDWHKILCLVNSPVMFFARQVLNSTQSVSLVSGGVDDFAVSQSSAHLALAYLC